MNTTRRLFVGIPISHALRKRLSQEMHTWPHEAVLSTAEDNLHITVLFIGFVREEDIADVCSRVGEVCQSVESFDLTFTKVELMESPLSPKMIWLSGEASEGLRILREELEKKFSVFVAQKKSYRPHIVLAKIKKKKWLQLSEKPALKDKLTLIEPIDTVAVYESLTIDGKRRYEEIDTFPLQ